MFLYKLLMSTVLSCGLLVGALPADPGTLAAGDGSAEVKKGEKGKGKGKKGKGKKGKGKKGKGKGKGKAKPASAATA